MAGDPGVGGLSPLRWGGGGGVPPPLDGWWGVIYPELAMLPSTYEIVCEEQAEETKTVQKDAEVVEWNSDSQIYWKILEADPEQIHFKSRLLTMLKR